MKSVHFISKLKEIIESKSYVLVGQAVDEVVSVEDNTLVCKKDNKEVQFVVDSMTLKGGLCYLNEASSSEDKPKKVKKTKIKE